MYYNHLDFIESVKKSFENYNQFGKRSSKKVSPIHNYLADVLCSIYGSEYEVYCSDRNKEFKATGKYYNKNIDITVVKDNNSVFCLGVKFITSNFKQNANNYFESMLGETANIQTNNIPYAHIIVFRKETPYYDKYGNVKKIEIIDHKDMSKYIKLMFDTQHQHKPFGLGITLIDINNDLICESEFEGLIKTKFTNERLFRDIYEYKQFLEGEM
jgi:hypothetical protein